MSEDDDLGPTMAQINESASKAATYVVSGSILILVMIVTWLLGGDPLATAYGLGGMWLLLGALEFLNTWLRVRRWARRKSS